MKHLSWLAGLTVGVLAVVPMTTTVVSAADPLNIWYVNPLPNTPDWGRSGKIFQDAAEANGYTATMVGPTKIDIPAMISQIEQAIADGADGIITCPLDPAAFKSVIDEAKSKGIIVASIGCVDPNANFSVGTGNEAYGRLSADFINEQVGGNAQVGILGTDQTSPNQVAQVNGFRAQLADKYPDMKEVVWEGDNSDAGIAAQKMGAMVAAYPEMNFLWIIEGAAPGAVPAALGEAGKSAGDIGVLAVDAQDSTLKAIEDGWITATLNQCWFDASANIARLIVEMKNDGKTAETFYEIPVDSVTKDRLPYTGCPAENSSQPFGY